MQPFTKDMLGIAYSDNDIELSKSYIIVYKIINSYS